MIRERLARTFGPWPTLSTREVHDWRVAAVACGVAAMGMWALGWFWVMVPVLAAGVAAWCLTRSHE